MTLESLSLENFRNFTKEKLQFSNLNMITGPNVAGKTNILDSIWILSFGKSFQAQEEIELLNFDKTYALIAGNFRVFYWELCGFGNNNI